MDIKEPGHHNGENNQAALSTHAPAQWIRREQERVQREQSTANMLGLPTPRPTNPNTAGQPRKSMFVLTYVDTHFWM